MSESHFTGPRVRSIRIEAPARLHLGFMDLHGGLGRQFGSLGLTLEDIATRITVDIAERNSATGACSLRAQRFVDLLAEHVGRELPARLVVDSAIPEHMGLGSGTQMGLAVGCALNALYDLKLDMRHIAGLLDRGARSGIGLGAFEQGGFLIDGGRSPQEGPPRITARLPFPEAWRLVLIFDEAVQGLHGEHEAAAFRALPAFPVESAAHLCRLTLMRILPALADGIWSEFGTGINELQRVVGDHYAAAQGGRFASARVAGVLNWLEQQGIAAVGQSSWGPTGFAVLDSEARALAVQSRLRAQFCDEAKLRFQLLAARNTGALITTDGRDTQSRAALR